MHLSIMQSKEASKETVLSKISSKFGSCTFILFSSAKYLDILLNNGCDNLEIAVVKAFTIVESSVILKQKCHFPPLNLKLKTECVRNKTNKKEQSK